MPNLNERLMAEIFLLDRRLSTTVPTVRSNFVEFLKPTSDLRRETLFELTFDSISKDKVKNGD